MLLYIQSDLYSGYEENNLVHTVQELNTLQSPLETFGILRKLCLKLLK